MSKPVKNIIRCRQCEDIVESKHTHDLQYCKCGSVYVDGGKEYQRYGGKNKEYIDLSYSVYED